MATEKLIHLTFKNTDLAKNPDAAKWKDKMEKIMNSEENIKIMEEAMVDCALYGQAFAIANIKEKIVNKTRLDPKDIFKLPDIQEATAAEAEQKQKLFKEFLCRII